MNNLLFEEIDFESLDLNSCKEIEGGLVPIAWAAIWVGVKIGVEVGGVLLGTYAAYRALT